MIEKLVELSLRERLVVYFTILLLAALGLYAFSQLPIEAYPDLVNTKVQIISQWPGRSAEELEKFVTIPLETEMNGIPHLISLRSTSLFGLSMVTLTFDDNTDDFFARTKVTEKLQNLVLPEGVNPQLAAESGPTGELYRYLLVGDSVSAMDLKTVEDWVLERQFKSVPGVVDVVSFGGPTKQYEIAINPQKLSYYGLSLHQVLESVSANNANAGGSIIEQGKQGFVFRGVGLLQDLEDINHVIVSSNQGTPVTVSQVADVRIGHQVRLGKVGVRDNDDAVEGIVLMRRGENASEVIRLIEEKVDEINEHILPKTMRIVPYYDRSHLIQTTTHTVLHNLVMGMLLVVATLFIFLGNIRSAAIAALVVPLALLIAFTLLWLRGMSANLLSLGAVDFGVIIDGAVLMVEAVFARLAAREITDAGERMSLVRTTAVEMSRPIFFSIVIIIAAMLPIFSFEKIEGKMFSPLAYTFGFALVGAMVLSLTFVPALASDLLKGRLREKSPVVEYIRTAYERSLRAALKHDKRILGVALAVLIISMYCTRFLGTEFLPHLNEGALWVRATMPMSISPSGADSTTSYIRKLLSDFDGVENVVSQLGRPDDGTDATGFFNAEFYVDLKPREEWKKKRSKEELIDEMNRRLGEISGVDFNFSQPIADNVEEAVLGVKGELAVKVYGGDLFRLEEAAQKIYSTLQTVPGITDIGIFREIGQPLLQANIDRMKAARYGLSVTNIQELIEASIGGKVATQLYEGEKHFDVVARIDEPYRNSLQKIGSLVVTGDAGQKVPLSLVSDITYQPGAAFIYREQNSRYIAVKFSVRDRDLGGAVSEAQQKVGTQVHLPPGYYTSWGGEFENQQRAMKRLALVVPLSLLIILIILYSTFDSWTYALLTLATVPFVTIGGIFGLLAAHLHFSVSAGIGFIALFGVSVQNGVVFLTYIKKHRAEFDDTVHLILFAGSHLVRPIIMVALLAMIGLMPAAFSTGIGSETQRPLAVVIVSGLFLTALINLYLLPILYKILGQRVMKSRAGSTPAA